MKLTKTIAMILFAALPLTVASCSSWFTTPYEPDRREDYIDPILSDSDTADPLEALLGEDATGIPSIDSPRLDVLGDGLQFYRIDDEQCVVVYNDRNAWMFDYRLNRVTPLVALDSMLAVADTTGRGAQYFDDCTIEYEFVKHQDIELRIEYTVTSGIAEASYSVYNFYTLFDEGEYNFDQKRGDTRGYYAEGITYPGAHEAFAIYDFDEYAKLGLSKESTLLAAARALAENDVTALEEVLYLEKGTLSSWEGMVIADYSLVREDFSSPWVDELILTMSVEESPLESYPAGDYRVTLCEGINGPVFSFEGAGTSADGTDYESGSAEEWVYLWAYSCGGWYDLLDMTPANESYAHMMLHFIAAANYMHGEPAAMKTGEDFKRLRAIYFPDGDIPSVYDNEEDITNCAHGGISRLCSVRETMAASGIHIVNVTYYADPMRSVVARELRVTLAELSDGQGYTISNIENIYETGLAIYGWST